MVPAGGPLPNPLIPAQDGRTRVTRLHGPGTVIRLLLDRSLDSADFEEPSQDAVAVIAEGSRVCFAVADGVSSSFLGQRSALILAEHLVYALCDTDLTLSLDDFRDTLADELDDLADRYEAEAARWPIPDDAPELMRTVLEQKREYGSESMFVCGVVESAADGPGAVRLAWLGDCQLRVLFVDGAQVDLVGETRHRWSTRRGVRGVIDVRGYPSAAVARILACSDGAVAALPSAAGLSDDELEAATAALAALPDSDDMALVDVAVVPSAMPPARRGQPCGGEPGATVGPGPEAPPPGLTAAVLADLDPVVVVQWSSNRTDGRTVLVTERRGHRLVAEPVPASGQARRRLAPGHYRLRLRVELPDRDHLWSAPVDIWVPRRALIRRSPLGTSGAE